MRVLRIGWLNKSNSERNWMSTEAAECGSIEIVGLQSNHFDVHELLAMAGAVRATINRPTSGVAHCPGEKVRKG